MSIDRGAFPREHTQDAGLNRIQAELQRLRTFAANCPFFEGVQVPATLVDTIPTKIVHKLGRAPQGVIVLYQATNPPAAVGFHPDASPFPDKFVYLVATTASVCVLWFF